MTINWNRQFSGIAQRTSPPEISWLMAQALEVSGLISLAAGFVDQQSLPDAEVKRSVDEILSSTSKTHSPLQYGTTHGDIEMRQLLVRRLLDEGVISPSSPVDESNVILGSGSQQVLYLAFEALLDPGDIVLLEAPTYFVVLGGIQSRGARTIGISVDENGLIPESLEETLKTLEQSGELSRVKMLYLMTYSTNPQGITLAGDRRKRIYDLVRGYNEKGYAILLLEDAAYRRLCFDDDTPAALYSFEEDDGFVMYTESFSKSLSPGLRAGFGVGPKTLVQKMVDIKGNHDFGSSNLSQQIIKAMLRSGEFDRHAAILRKRYYEKWTVVRQVLTERMPPEVKWITPGGGFYTWIDLPQAVDTGAKSDFFQLALDEKVLYVPGSLCYSADRAESTRSSSLRLSFGMIGDNDLREGCARLARAVQHSYGAAV